MNENNKKNNMKKNDIGKPPEDAVKELTENVSIPKKDYEELLAKVKEAGAFEEKLLRSHAEFENARRRIEKEKHDFVKYANEGFILELLPILDSLEIAEKHIKEAKDFEAVRVGVDMIQLQIQKFVKDLGLERIKALNEKFDPHVHEAVETVESPDKADGLIVDEMKPGYKFNGKLLRPAIVKIIKHTEGKK